MASVRLLAPGLRGKGLCGKPNEDDCGKHIVQKDTTTRVRATLLILGALTDTVLKVFNCLPEPNVSAE
eukprot:5512129-Amphidinium_carterae.1